MLKTHGCECYSQAFRDQNEPFGREYAAGEIWLSPHIRQRLERGILRQAMIGEIAEEFGFISQPRPQFEYSDGICVHKRPVLIMILDSHSGDSVFDFLHAHDTGKFWISKSLCLNLAMWWLEVCRKT